MSFSSDTFTSSFATLTPEQKGAVLHTDGPALVIAGAGSGKTKVVTLRLAHLIKEGINPSSLVAVTFTNKAAGEMKERTNALCGSLIQVSTFHSLGAKILREAAPFLGYTKDFVIYDEEESLKALKSILRGANTSSLEDESSQLRSAISRIKNGTKLDTSEISEERAYTIFERYQDLLRRSQAVDFDDLIYLPLELCRNHPEALQAFQARWSHLLVDEYQDANDSQSELVRHLAGEKRNIFAVGDPDQSIYSWRGANIQHILRFQEQFPEAKLFRLEQNFRSTSTILAASNAVIEQNIKRLDKRLWSANGEGEKIGIFVARTEREESSFLGDSIESLLSSNPAKEIAILYRTNAQSRSIEDALMTRSIPYRIIGGLSFYERREIKDILAYIRLILHPNDMIAFERALIRPKRGIGATTLEKINEVVSTSGISYLECARLLGVGECPNLKLPEKQKTSFASFYASLKEAAQALQERNLSKAIMNLIQDSGYLSFLENEPETLVERKENLEQLILKAEEWQEEHKEDPISLFLEDVTLDPGADGDILSDEKKIILMTAHNAKGLEFENVFITGLEEDLFPHIHSKMGKGEVEEERRLFYVAMTRAKKRLTLSCSQTRMVWGGIRSMRPSRFLKEIQREHLNPLKSALKNVSFQEKPTVSQKITENFSPGTLLFHTHFGVGKVEKVIPSPNGDLLKVLFSKDGSSKTLLKECAPIKRIN